MGFYFRKSAKFGSIRLNFSKSGIGVSTGIKGVRISTGPRGTYVHAGANGFYYKHKVSGLSNQKQPINNQDSYCPNNENINFQPSEYSEADKIHSADVSELVDASKVVLQIEEIPVSCAKTFNIEGILQTFDKRSNLMQTEG